MKKTYCKPVIECVRLFNNISLCTTSEIDVVGGTDHFDARRKRGYKWEDEEEEEDEDE